MSESAYLGRHNQVAKLIHQHLALRHELIEKNTPPYYKYSPREVLESANYLLYWDRPILTDKTVDFNRPDLILINKKEKNAIIIDVAVPLSHNVKKTENEKRSKYDNLRFEIKRLWKLNEVTIYPVVISAEGIVSTDLRDIFSALNIPTIILVESQKAVLLQTCHIIRKFLNGHS